LNQYSLLAHVAPRLTTQFENLATESLLYLLQRYGEARGAFVDLASTVGFVGPRDLTFDTQVHMEYGSIPDLVGATKGETNVLLVESKFWASLTPNQPTGYLNRLPADREGMVLFIAPERRYEELWRELMGRCLGEGFELTEEAGEPPNWRVARTSKGRLAYVSWSFALGHLEMRLKEAEDDRGAHEVWQLTGLCQKLEKPFVAGASGSQERKALLRSIVDEVGRRLSEAGLFDTKGFRATPGPDYYRRFGTLAGHMTCSIAYDEQYAARFEESLLWLRGPRGSAEEDFGPSLAGAEHPFRCYELDGRLLFPLDVPEQGAREVVVQSLTTQVAGIAELLWQGDPP
jgi:hypothetical protein